jgi:predicted deacetylase
MSARYLIRMDDACPTMDISKWQALEELFDDFGIQPIVAVVPDNHDPNLNLNTFDYKFWDKVRSWQNKGWTIAMHGHRHLMHYTESKLILPFYKRSEFAGLPYEQQAEKIRKAWELFVLQSIKPTVWIAPAHCFDFDTLKAVYDETPIRIVSDGIACNTYYEYEFFWIPQQIWEFSERSSGLWTVCLHPNTMLDRDISGLRDMIERKFLSRIIGVNNLNLSKNPKTLIDRTYSVYFWKRRCAYQYFDKIRSLLR